ncbi:MAG: AzlD domain-containing protein [Clostridia bacterium]|nr:AzlD domain-containing protein [Clostridia bacterium]MBR5427281.1 AzlD domain-containing protein [Clostridia bacterium]
MKHNVYVYIFICMALVTYLIRILPLTLIRKEIKNRFFRSFLYYVPYVTLAVMTFPAILDATQSPVSAVLALIAAIAAAFFGGSLFTVALTGCVTVFISELVMDLIIK